MESLIHRLSRRTYMRMPYYFCTWVIPGMRIYCKLLKCSEKGSAILVHPWPGTGDIFLLHEYLSDYCRKNHITSYTVVVTGNAAKKIVDMFNVQRVVQLTEKEMFQLTHFYQFAGGKQCSSLKILHHCPPGIHIRLYDQIQGINKTTTRDILLEIDLGLSTHSKISDTPAFSTDLEGAKTYLVKNGLKPGKTVIFAPYTNSCDSTFPQEAWELLAACFIHQGYSVCTNCVGKDEKPVKNTIAITFSFTDSISVLEAAGIFIANRSGLCDVIGNANCKKIILYQYNVFCGMNHIFDYWGLENIGLGNDILEIEFYPLELAQVIDRIFEYLNLEKNYRNTKKFHKLHCFQAPNPIYKTNYAAVVFCVGPLFVPQLCVALKSLIANTSEKHFYDILVLGYQLSIGMIENITRMAEKFQNVKIRVIKMDGVLQDCLTGGGNEFELTKSMNVMLPSILLNYNRVIYLDCDLIVNEDIYQLVDLDIGSNLIGAASDIGVLLTQYEKKSCYIREHIQKGLGLQNLREYISTGVMVMNLSELRKIMSPARMAWLFHVHKWPLLNRDIWAEVCRDKIFLLDQSWNLMVQRKEDIEKWKQTKLVKKYIQWQKSPKIVHYIQGASLRCGEMGEITSMFWEYAKDTPYYEYLIYHSLPERVVTIKTESIGKRIKHAVKGRIIKPLVNSMFPRGINRERVREILRFRG